MTLRPEARLTQSIVADEDLPHLAILYTTCQEDARTDGTRTAQNIMLGVRQALINKIRHEIRNATDAEIEALIRYCYDRHDWQIPESSLDDVVVDVCNDVIEGRYDLADALDEIATTMPYTMPIAEVNRRFVDATFGIIAFRK